MSRQRPRPPRRAARGSIVHASCKARDPKPGHPSAGGGGRGGACAAGRGGAGPVVTRLGRSADRPIPGALLSPGGAARTCTPGSHLREVRVPVRCGACSRKADLRPRRWRPVGRGGRGRAQLPCPEGPLTSSRRGVRNHLRCLCRARRGCSHTSRSPRFTVGETEAGEANVAFRWAVLSCSLWGKPRTCGWSLHSGGEGM